MAFGRINVGGKKASFKSIEIPSYTGKDDVDVTIWSLAEKFISLKTELNSFNFSCSNPGGLQLKIFTDKSSDYINLFDESFSQSGTNQVLEINIQVIGNYVFVSKITKIIVSENIIYSSKKIYGTKVERISFVTARIRGMSDIETNIGSGNKIYLIQ